jgi:hypothetical protein
MINATSFIVLGLLDQELWQIKVPKMGRFEGPFLPWVTLIA